MNEQDEIKRRQKERSRLTAILLLLFVALVFGITIAKMGLAS
ncbi:hypothetical protein [Sphingomicrobium lutaoense]|uniref:Cytochrome C oxidase assembly protein n=1 Tax=Sphingomicrobium lutaoense TaxID=515949 RepID=A0A839Z4F0_9SPHN|nr:hypothetical protein [Sphingomicrobium lutaoense]MBB3764977.1 hypothetical protein [Sphingomicrobium lutaoense]